MDGPVRQIVPNCATEVGRHPKVAECFPKAAPEQGIEGVGDVEWHCHVRPCPRSAHPPSWGPSHAWWRPLSTPQPQPPPRPGEYNIFSELKTFHFGLFKTTNKMLDRSFLSAVYNWNFVLLFQMILSLGLSSLYYIFSTYVILKLFLINVNINITFISNIFIVLKLVDSWRKIPSIRKF